MKEDRDLKEEAREEEKEKRRDGEMPEDMSEAAEKERDTVTLPRSEYERLKDAAARTEEYKDRYLRSNADIDNAWKRLNKEREEFLKYANEELLSEVLSIVDNFDRAIEHMKTREEDDSIMQGIRIIQKQFHHLLESKGIERIETKDKTFDPHLHEAVEHVKREDADEDMIVEEVQPGYLLNGRLLRPAAVKVSKREKKKEENE